MQAVQRALGPCDLASGRGADSQVHDRREQLRAEMYGEAEQLALNPASEFNPFPIRCFRGMPARIGTGRQEASCETLSS